MGVFVKWGAIMAKSKILIQLDPDAHASVFDAVVAVDAGVEHLLQYHSVQPEQVRDLVHGAMFTRHPQDLLSTAIFIGGSNVAKGEEACQAIRNRVPEAKVEPVVTGSAAETAAAVTGAQVVIAAGAAGIQLLSAEGLKQSSSLQVAIDLNAVSPLGIEGIGVQDKAKDIGGVLCYGAIGVGGTKMKIHRAAIEKLFTQNDLVLDAEEVFALGQALK